ncbi:hypothetical protein DL769_010547 [Monosporascus sp. CRB-8-3]|nr:hypothetical protein DL769_010547 [Monosporascus sp. CRB-8-3]
MADVYVPPFDHAYLLKTPFYMPGDGDDRWAISLSNNDATLMAAALGVIITISSFLLWNLIRFLGILIAGEGKLSRHAELIAILNSNEPWFAFKELLYFTVRSFRDSNRAPTKADDDTADPKTKLVRTATKTNAESRDDFWYGLVFCLLAFAALSGGITIGVMAPSLAEIGTVAPARPSIVFYPLIPDPSDPAEILQDSGLRAPAMLRALGGVEESQSSLRSRISVEIDSHEPRGEDRVISLEYSYGLSGLEMGLRWGYKLDLAVKGFCITEYEWESEGEEDSDDMDLYNLWNDSNQQSWVLLNDNDITHAPSAAFRLNTDPANNATETSNITYAILIHSAHRSSISEGDDPWYATEPRDDNAPETTAFNPEFWIRRHRPVLSCWEKSTWSYGGRTVDTVWDLKHMPDIKIPQVLLMILETTFGGGPMVFRIGNTAGDSALKSRITSPNGVIDAGRSSVVDDMQRLIIASFLATRNVFVDATLFGVPDRYGNMITGPDGRPREGAGDFVLSSSDIQTFSMTGIVTLMAVFGALVLVNLVISILVFVKRHGGGSGRWTRFQVSGARQLFRPVYEPEG